MDERGGRDFATLYCSVHWNYNDVIKSTMVSQIISLTIVHSTVYSGANQRKHQCSASLAFAREIHQWPVNSPHKGQVTRKSFSIWWRHHGHNSGALFSKGGWGVGGTTRSNETSKPRDMVFNLSYRFGFWLAAISDNRTTCDWSHNQSQITTTTHVTNHIKLCDWSLTINVAQDFDIAVSIAIGSKLYSIRSWGSLLLTR